MIPLVSRMPKYAIVLALLVTLACGSSDPNLRAADWEEHFDRSRQGRQPVATKPLPSLKPSSRRILTMSTAT
jgi:hypothetical protein